MSYQSVWQLRSDVIWTLILLGLATGGRAGEVKPEVHLYLGDRYCRLSEYHAKRGATRKAQRLWTKAERHLRLGGWDPLPPAAAMAMPIPKRPTLTEAIGWRIRETPPDDAA